MFGNVIDIVIQCFQVIWLISNSLNMDSIWKTLKSLDEWLSCVSIGLEMPDKHVGSFKVILVIFRHDSNKII